MAVIDGRDRTGAAQPEVVAEAMARLARRGYGRRFEFRSGRLWCPSCEIIFDRRDLHLDASVAVVVDGRAAAGVLCALRCATCRASGVWLVEEHDEQALRLFDQLRAGTPRPDPALGAAGTPPDTIG